MTDSLAEYFAALGRLKNRKEKINNDTVSIEAGRKKGSIKKSRPQFKALILAIEDAQTSAENPKADETKELDDAKENAKSLERQLNASLCRELSLAREVFQLRKELAALRGGSVIPFQPPAQPSASE
ncbi:hypothetical protein ABH945_000690 [Paraburkholderia sp. GAS333]|uniref:hypothetical protein n=1 Tax=Paraburkholderia sp. GAS333 TaxID=3156279 RepID=UPI003D22123C